MVFDVPSLSEVVSYGLLAFSIGFVAGKGLITFVRVLERAFS